MPVANARCLSHPSALTSWLRFTNDELLAAIECGTIPVAFDLRTPGSERATLRLWFPNVEALVRSGGRDCGPVPDLDEVLSQIIPGTFDVRSSRLERDWAVSHQHVHELVSAGCLPIRQRRQQEQGPLSFDLLAADGLRAFLASRLTGV